jgi:hypothetical protein
MMLREMPSLDLAQEAAAVEAPYPLHNKDGYVEFITGMFLHTREQRGPADSTEVWALTKGWPIARRVALLQLLHKHGQVV